MNDIPSYLTIICDLQYNIIDSSVNLSSKSLMEIVDRAYVEILKDHIQNFVTFNKGFQITQIKLVNNKDYYVNLDFLHDKLYITFQNTEEINKAFWEKSIERYNNCMLRSYSVISTIAHIVEQIFYANRSNLNDIIKDLCTSLDIKKGIVVFKNGTMHALSYTKDNNSCDYINNDVTFECYDDDSFNKNIEYRFSDILELKKYKDTYYNYCVPEQNEKELEKSVFVLKLSFENIDVGYFEFVLDDKIKLLKSEIELIQSLSGIIAYTVYNKCEETNLINFIKEKFSTL